MEEKTQLAPPTILSPKEGDKVEKLVIEGLGEPFASIELNFCFWAENHWKPMADANKNGTWSFTPEGPELEAPGRKWIRVRQRRNWPVETSEPTEKVNYQKVLDRPRITKPLKGESLPLIEQTIQGHGHAFTTRVEIELVKISPLPTGTYKNSTNPDGGGFWTTKPNWALTSGSYALKARQIYERHDITYESNWTNDLPIVIK